MKRDLSALADQRFDVLVIGGGIYGACVAWEAASRGLSVALIDKSDFAAATSANSLKMIHGGLRYLQQADIKRMRESIAEQQTLLRIAPHLVQPIPVLIPTYGYGTRGKPALAVATMVSSALGQRLSNGESLCLQAGPLSRAECLGLLPGLDGRGLTGGYVFYDAQVYNSERLVLSFIESAAGLGAQAANYVRCLGFLREEGRVTGVHALDELEGHELVIRARTVVNTTGPWVFDLLQQVRPQPAIPARPFAKAINLVTRQLFDGFVAGVPAPPAAGARNGKRRMLFIAAWHGASLVGTDYILHRGKVDDCEVTPDEIDTFIDAVNSALPSAALTRHDVRLVHKGLLPAVGETTGEPRLQAHSKLIHYDNAGARNLFSVVSTKYTTAHHTAQQVVDAVAQASSLKVQPSRTGATPLHDGAFTSLTDCEAAVIRRYGNVFETATLRNLVRNYGSAADAVLSQTDATIAVPADPHDRLVEAQTRYAVRHEMAHTLADVVFRRTDLGSVGHPGDRTLDVCAQAMADELGWSEQARQAHIDAVNRHFPQVRQPAL